MNKKTISLIAILLLTVFGFSSCENDDRWWSENTLVGTWYTSSYDGYNYTSVEFYSNNQGVIEQYDGDFLTDRAYFFWEASGYYIYFRYTDRPSETWNIRFDGRDAFRLYFNNGDYTYFVRDGYYYSKPLDKKVSGESKK